MCQIVLAEWRGKKVGTLGTAGCFSFQASKNLNCGEGGAILSDDQKLIQSCFAFHNHGRGRTVSADDFGYSVRGTNLKMTEFQAAILLAQMTRLEEQARRRDENAGYLNRMLAEIPGIEPSRMPSGGTRAAPAGTLDDPCPKKKAGSPPLRGQTGLSSKPISPERVDKVAPYQNRRHRRHWELAGVGRRV